jgi:cytochrome P450
MSPLASIPELPGAGILGHVRELREDRLAFVERLARDTDELCTIRLFTRSAVFVNSPRLLHEVLVEKAKSFEKSSVLRYMLYPLAGEGLFTSGGDLWRRQRKLMSPIFQPAQIAHFADSMVESAARAAATWSEGSTVDLARETMRITMSIAGRTLFEAETFGEADTLGEALTVALDWASSNAGTAVPILQEGVRKAIVRASTRLPPSLGARARAAAESLHGPLHLVPTTRSRKLEAAIAVLDDRVQRMIDERRAATGAKRADLLTKLLEARDEDDGLRMSDKQVRDEVLTLFVAGHETTATALAWGIYLLLSHPEAHRRALAEVDALGGRPPRLADLPRLSYLLQVFKESLRLYPPVYLFSRQASQPVVIGGHALPEGTVVFTSPYTIHRRADLWPDPLRFDPSRFTPEAEEARPRQAFLPFSAGPRVCIGNHFALMEGPLVLATMLQHARFELLSSQPIAPEPSATLRPRGGVPVRVRLRPSNRAAESRV